LTSIARPLFHLDNGGKESFNLPLAVQEIQYQYCRKVPCIMAKAPAKKAPKEAFKLVQRRNGRWSVKGSNGKFINGAEKVAILSSKGLIKVMTKKAGGAEA
jgi:hypothetical protein